MFGTKINRKKEKKKPSRSKVFRHFPEMERRCLENYEMTEYEIGKDLWGREMESTSF